MATAEIITIGDELLSGETVDTNASYLDAELERLGFLVQRHTTVPDELDTIAEAFRASAERADLVISSGGLGPTEDDLTLAGLGRALDLPLVRHEPTISAIRERFARFGREMTPNNERQAMVPEGTEVIENKSGTAPCVRARIGRAEVYLLPGVPREVRYLMSRVLGPRLDRGAPVLHRRTVKVVGLGESRLEHTVLPVVERHRGRVRFGYRALGIENHIKLAAEGLDAKARLDDVEAELRECLSDAIFGVDQDELMSVLHGQLLAAACRLATAESCTGGLIGKMLTDQPGSSAYFVGGVVAYANRAKTDLLGVPAELIESEGAVSEAVARAMAEGARSRFAADYALSATGIAGPEGGTLDKPVGTVFVGLASPDGTEVRRLQLPGDRSTIRQNTAVSVLDLLRRRLA